MPWKESRIVDQRLRFLSTYQKEEMSVSELCREFEVSRPMGRFFQKLSYSVLYLS